MSTYISEFHEWKTGNVITAARLNGNIDNIINGLKQGNRDINVLSLEVGGNSAINSSREAALTKAAIDNITINGSTISSTETNGNIVLSPDGTGAIVSNNSVDINGDLDVDHLNLNGNTISSTDTNGDINLTPNGTGGVVAGGSVAVDNVKIDGNDITSTDTDGDLNLTPNGAGDLVLDGLKWPQADGTAGYAVVTDGSGQLSFSSYLSAGLTYTEVNIGDWNMNATDSVTVAHGLSATEWKTVRDVQVIIRDDSDATYRPLDCVTSDTQTIGVSDGITSWGGISSIDSTNITLYRIAEDDFFDNTDYDSTSYNRGWVRIGYTAD